MKKTIIIYLVFCLLIPISAMAGGGWPKPKGRLYIKLSEYWVIANQHFTIGGGIDPNLTRGNFITSVYAEYGVTNRLTGIVYFPFFSRATLNEQVSGTTGDVIIPGEAINSIGDTDIQLKYGLFQEGPFKTSVSLTLGLPTGVSEGGSDGSLQTGDGEFNQMVSIDVSRSIPIGKLNTYASLMVGFNNRTRNFSDEFRYGLEAGIVQGRFIGILRFQGIQSLKNGDPNFNSSGTSLFGNNVSYLAFQPEVGYKFTDKFGISASVGMALFGELIFANPSFTVGAFFDL
jgi:hypothetical protein